MTAWKALFEAVNEGDPIKVDIGFLGDIAGEYDGHVEWYSRDESVEFQGIVLATGTGVMIWIPYDQIRGVHLL